MLQAAGLEAVEKPWLVQAAFRWAGSDPDAALRRAALGRAGPCGCLPCFNLASANESGMKPPAGGNHGLPAAAGASSTAPVSTRWSPSPTMASVQRGGALHALACRSKRTTSRRKRPRPEAVGLSSWRPGPQLPACARLPRMRCKDSVKLRMKIASALLRFVNLQSPVSNTEDHLHVENTSCLWDGSARAAACMKLCAHVLVDSA